MKYPHLFGVILLILMLNHLASAQSKLNDTLHLNEVIINTISPIDLSGFKKTEFSSQQLEVERGNSLSSILSKQSSVIIKNYGPGSLASSSIRGADASHTQVIWNGITINSPMLGQMDFSEVPVYFIDNLELIHGGSSLVNNSGALGGCIQMDNRPNWKNNATAQYSYETGSFRTNNHFATLRLGNSKFEYRGRLALQNDDFAKTSIDKIENSKHKREGLLNELYFRPSLNNQLSAKVWFQNANSNLPSATPNDETSSSKSIRTSLEWIHVKPNSKLTLRSNWSIDNYTYDALMAKINSDNDYQVLQSFGEWIKNYSPKLKFSAGLNHVYSNVQTNNYISTKDRHILAGFVSANYSITNKLTSFMLIKQEVFNGKILPIMPSLGFELLPLYKHQLAIKANISKNYRVPTFNDLFWLPGGNANLKNENGLSGEFAISYKQKHKDFEVFTEITHFQSIIDNWIKWVPVSASISTAKNIRQVHSQGAEFVANSKLKTAKLNFYTNLTYSYTLAKNRKTYDLNQNTLNKQLIFVPKHKFTFSQTMEHKLLTFEISAFFTSKSYTTSDNQMWEPAYCLVDSKLFVHLPIKNAKIDVGLMLDNILDKSYSTIPGYEMPGRNYKLSIRFNISKNVE
jgi:outer membrane cobalamin receptor